MIKEIKYRFYLCACRKEINDIGPALVWPLAALYIIETYSIGIKLFMGLILL